MKNNSQILPSTPLWVSPQESGFEGKNKETLCLRVSFCRQSGGNGSGLCDDSDELRLGKTLSTCRRDAANLGKFRPGKKS